MVAKKGVAILEVAMAGSVADGVPELSHVSGSAIRTTGVTCSQIAGGRS